MGQSWFEYRFLGKTSGTMWAIWLTYLCFHALCYALLWNLALCRPWSQAALVSLGVAGDMLLVAAVLTGFGFALGVIFVLFVGGLSRAPYFVFVCILASPVVCGMIYGLILGQIQKNRLGANEVDERLPRYIHLGWGAAAGPLALFIVSYGNSDFHGLTGGWWGSSLAIWAISSVHLGAAKILMPRSETEMRLALSSFEAKPQSSSIAFVLVGIAAYAVYVSSKLL